MTAATARDSDYQRIFTGNRRISVQHFYGVGSNEAGKWFSYGYVTDDGTYVAGLTVFDGDHFVASGLPLYGPGRDDDGDVTSDTFDHARADARLIAAAPELLAACKAMLEANYMPNSSMDIAVRAQNAIVKAS